MATERDLHRCQQCGRDMGPEWFLGPVCGKCCRANVTGRKVAKHASGYGRKPAHKPNRGR